MKLGFIFMGFLLFCFVPALSAQNDGPEAETADNQNAEQNSPDGKFRGFSLGMNLDELKEALTQDQFFAFKGDRDVSFLPITEQNLVESEGVKFVKRAFFQLKGEKVFIMAFSFNTDLIDHYSIYTTLTEKYGEPEYLNPEEAVWESGTVRLSIERPLTVKYIDKVVFNEIVRSSNIEKGKQRELREEFLDDF